MESLYPRADYYDKMRRTYSRVGRLGWHTKFSPDGVPLLNDTFNIFGKV